jgi:hypothetical protein
MLRAMPFSKTLQQLWGKLRRFFLVGVRKKKVLDMLSRRHGACNRCGACCKLLFQCPAYDESDGEPRCLIYNDRPGVCGLFPLDERDLADRDLVMPEQPCGFFFVDHLHAVAGKTRDLRYPDPSHQPLPLRIKGRSVTLADYDNIKGRKKNRVLTGPIAILWTSIRRPKLNRNGNGRLS